MFLDGVTAQYPAILLDSQAVVDHKLYWTRVDSQEEALFIISVLNSETARAKTEHLQSRGQWGARDFDKVMLSLPIPKFDPKQALHRGLAQAAQRAEKVAGEVPLPEGTNFITARRRVREALREDGVAQQIDDLVAQLLG